MLIGGPEMARIKKRRRAQMKQFELLGPDSIESISWSDREVTEKYWFKLFLTTPTNQLIKNIQTDFRLLRLGKVLMPVTINNEEFKNSFVCSPYTTYMSYAIEELQKLGLPIMTKPLEILLIGMGHLIKSAKINKVIQCNNWLLSTNHYEDFSIDLITKVTLEMKKLFPEHYILFRSLNYYSNSDLIQKLRSSGYLLIPTRQIYIFDRSKEDYLKRNHLKRDLKLIKKGNFTLLNHSEIKATDYHRIIELYNALYLEKHSYYNPMFTPQFIENCHKNNIMQMYGLLDSDGKLQGIIGYFTRSHLMTTPFIGYNTSLSQKLGLYRILIALVLRDAAEKNITLNLSSGASEFKRLRGGKPEIEYSAAYIKHLSLKRKVIIFLLSELYARLGVPVMKILKL